ncbi:hypothetical protein Ancab_025728 [Ancistrocladus abbreviatus]
MDAYSSILERTRVPQASLQRFAVIQLFHSLRSAPPHLSPDSDAGREAITQCLHSSLPAVVDQSVRELCRLVKDSQLDLSRGLLELQSALEGSQAHFVDVFVKGIGFLVRVGFQRDWFDVKAEASENHPFIKVLSCRIEVQNVLIEEVLLFMVQCRQYGLVKASEFLRPLLNFSILRIPFTGSSSPSFAKLLVSSLASLCCSFPSDAIPFFNLLIGCLRYYQCKTAEDHRDFLALAELIVDAHVVVLRHLVRAGLMVHEAQKSAVKLLDALLSPYSDLEKQTVGNEPVLHLSRRLLAVQKELGLCYLPELASSLLSLVIKLTTLELEHEQLCMLNLVSFVLKWKIEDEHAKARVSSALTEVLFIFPIINLMSSPSKSVKGAATDLLFLLEKISVNLFASPREELSVQVGLLSISKPGGIVFRLLQHIWLQDLPSTLFFLNVSSIRGTDVKEMENGSKSWISGLKEYAQRVVERRKSFHPVFHSQEMTVNEMPLLLSSLLGVLLLHNSLGSFAAEALNALGVMEPKLGVTLLLAIIYYSYLLRNNNLFCPDMQLHILAMLPFLAMHTPMVPLVVQTMTPMLCKDVKPVLYATAIRLLCKSWEINDRIFGSLQAVLLPERFNEFISDRAIGLSTAASLRDVCRRNPDRGVELILSVSESIENHDPVIQVLGFQSLGHLCEADAVDFYTAWKVIAEHVLDYSADAIVACGLCQLLRWGASDAEAYPEASRNILQILWEVGSSGQSTGDKLWMKARVSAFEALYAFEVVQIENSIQNFKERFVGLLILETNVDVLRAMEELEAKIIAHEHSTRRRLVKEKRVTGNKIEKLLSVFPRVILSSGKMSNPGELPGAALLCPSSRAEDANYQVQLKNADDVLGWYTDAIREIAASLHLSRNLVVALLSLQSWKPFMQHWIRAYLLYLDVKEPSIVLDKTSKAANDIVKIMIQMAEDSIPRSAENIALAIGALCMALPPSVHDIKITASKFLLNWLFQYEHEHRQWSAAISLGLISSLAHVTDRKQKVENIDGLIKVAHDSRNTLIKGACGVGLGFSCQDLLTRVVVVENTSEKEIMDQLELDLLGKIVRALSVMICQLTQSSSDILWGLSKYVPPGSINTDVEITFDSSCMSCDEKEEDIWGVAGLVLGLGSCISVLYRAGSYDDVCDIKSLLISWITDAHSLVKNYGSCIKDSHVLVAPGACLALPTVVSFCQRVELINDNELDMLVVCYKEIISGLLYVKTSGTFHQGLLMASCVGAGDLLACILGEGVHSLEVQHVEELLELMRKTYSSPYPHIIHFGAMLGVVNAMGAGAGSMIHHQLMASSQTANGRKSSSRVMGPLFSSSAFQLHLTSLMQDMFLVAQNSDDHQQQQYAAWAVSFLRYRLWSQDVENCDNIYKNENANVSVSQSFSEDSTVLKLSLWLMHLDSSQTASILHVSTVTAVLRCLSRAPRLPGFDWGAVIRRCMRYEAQVAELFPQDSVHVKGALREECIRFSLAHANKFEPLLVLLDELSDLSRFRILHLNLQSRILLHLLDLIKLFSSSRLEKLFNDIAEYLSSPISPYQNHSPRQKGLLRISCWKGLSQCHDEGSLSTSDYIPFMERCMEVLFSILPVSSTVAISEQENVPTAEEWNVATRCLGKSRRAWLFDLLQISEITLSQRDDCFSITVKKIQARAWLVRLGSFPLTELGKLKVYILNAASEGLWDSLVEVIAALQHAEGSVKRQWLIDVLEISCVAKFPSTALQFLGLLSGSFCRYMPLLILDPTAVLSDLPVTLASLLSSPSWRIIAETAASRLWTSMERIHDWSTSLACGFEAPSMKLQPIDPSENEMADFLRLVMHETCVSLKEYLPLDKQLRLVNMIAH